MTELQREMERLNNLNPTIELQRELERFDQKNMLSQALDFHDRTRRLETDLCNMAFRQLPSCCGMSAVTAFPPIRSRASNSRTSNRSG